MTISVPEAMMASRMRSPEANFPVPSMSRDWKERPAMVRGDWDMLNESVRNKGRSHASRRGQPRPRMARALRVAFGMKEAG